MVHKTLLHLAVKALGKSRRADRRALALGHVADVGFVDFGHHDHVPGVGHLQERLAAGGCAGAREDSQDLPVARRPDDGLLQLRGCPGHVLPQIQQGNRVVQTRLIGKRGLQLRLGLLAAQLGRLSQLLGSLLRGLQLASHNLLDKLLTRQLRRWLRLLRLLQLLPVLHRHIEIGLQQFHLFIGRFDFQVQRFARLPDGDKGFGHHRGRVGREWSAVATAASSTAVIAASSSAFSAS